MSDHIVEKQNLFSYIDASTPLLEEIEEMIRDLKANPDDTSLLNTYFRLIYTLKGTALCVGLKNIPKFAQSYGELIGKLQWQQMVLTPEVLDALTRGLDQLKHMFAEARLGNFEVEIVDCLEFTGTHTVKKIEIAENNVNDKIGVSIHVLDKFMELSGQFTVLRNTLIKSASALEQKYYGDKELVVMVDSLTEMHKVSSTLQNNIAEMRKISIDSVYKPLTRFITDTAKATNKSVEIKVQGEDLKIDTSISKILTSALMHIVRNSIDHGIETVDKREALGKNKSGLINLKSYDDGDNIVIEMSDDGGGLNIASLKQRAVDKGLYTDEQVSHMSNQRVFSIIFEAGFSSARMTDDVGLDVVLGLVESVGGKILVDSQEGVGTKFTLLAPTPKSVLIIKSLMIKFSGSIYSIPLDQVAEVVCLEEFKDSKVLHHVEQSLILRHHDELIPLVDLAQTLGDANCTHKDNVLNVVLVKTDGLKYGIIVDQIMDIEEIVVKKMSAHFKQSNYFMGVTFIGQGELALILNLTTIAKKSQIKANDINISGSLYTGGVAQSDNMEFMQFNFRNSKNYAFPLTVVSRLEEVKTAEVEFSGAIPLVRYREDFLPLLFIERQLGLCPVEDNLTLYYPEIVKVIVVNAHNKIFGIVVEEILDIGLTAERVETDSVDRDGVMGTIFIGNSTVSILDVSYLIQHYLEFEHKLAEKEFEKNNVEEEWHLDKAA